MTRRIGPEDRGLLASGRHADLAELLGAHLEPSGVRFGLWAPNADRVEVIGDWNDWGRAADDAADLLAPDDSGVWTGTAARAEHGMRYKYRIRNRDDGSQRDKTDPAGFFHEEPPATASRIVDLDWAWNDADWMAARRAATGLDEPMSIYEMHLGSWRYEPGGYRAIAQQLADHLDHTGFTHVELLPVMEHPYYPSWGYQTLGYFAPSSRYGTPQDFKFFVDHLHQRGYGVILDWVPSHFPADGHGLARFDGTHLFEHADPRLGFHPDWKSCIWNYERPEVRSFLISSAMFWLDEYHVDGIRVDAVASMLYRDYSRAEGEWIPNEHGGRENLGAVQFMQDLNTAVYDRWPGVHMIAEESTAWHGVSHPVDGGGLGFGMKWDMGWMHDTLEYLKRDPVHRGHHHDEITFRMIYAFNENFLLALSHDEVVHGKGSLLEKMPGDDWQRFANLRLLFTYQWSQPGKKLLFMGSEFGSPVEWTEAEELPWGLLSDARHRGVQDLVADLNRVLRTEPALHRADFDPSGFAWVIGDDRDNGVLAFERRASGARPVLAVLNMTPVARHGYRVGVDAAGRWDELLNSDAERYGGSNVGNFGAVAADPIPMHGRTHSVAVTVPPLGGLLLAPATAPSPD